MSEFDEWWNESRFLVGDAHKAFARRAWDAALAKREAMPVKESLTTAQRTSEWHFAMRDAHEASDSDAYFKARPQADSGHNRHIFREGFVRGFDAGEEVYAAKREAVAEGWIPHNGGVCPVRSGTLIDFRKRNGDIYLSTEAYPLGGDWTYLDNPGSGEDIVAWRLAASQQAAKGEGT